MNPLDFLRSRTESLREAVASAPSNLVRTDRFQDSRDFLLDYAKVNEPEKRFIQSMTGGLNEGITELPEEFIGSIKGVYNEKQRQIEMLNRARAELKANPKKYEWTDLGIDEETGEWTKEIVKPGTVDRVLRSDDFYGRWNVPGGVVRQPEEGNLVSFYGAPRDLAYSLGHANVSKDKEGNLHLTDTWDVDHDPEVAFDPVTKMPIMKFVPGGGKNLYYEEHGTSGDYVPTFTGKENETQKGYSDLIEGGRLASGIYNLARRLGTYKPLQYDVHIPAEDAAQHDEVTPSLSTPRSKNDYVYKINKFLDKFGL